MKKPLGHKLLGFTLVILSILGLLFSVSGMVATWIVRTPIQDSLSEVLSSLEDAFSNSQEGFMLIDQVIAGLLADFDIFVGSFESLETTLAGVSDSLGTSSDLIGDDLKQTVLGTQTSLNSAAVTAELIDKALTFLSKIPLLGVDYDPEIPLHISLEQVANDLETFPATFDQIESGLNTTTDGLGFLQSDLTEFSDQIQDIEDDLESAQVVLKKFNDSIETMKTRLATLNDNLPTYFTILSLSITGGLFWLGLAQIPVLSQGLLFLKGESTVINLVDDKKK
mgnify:CR=1 FL=1